MKWHLLFPLCLFSLVFRLSLFAQAPLSTVYYSGIDAQNNIGVLFNTDNEDQLLFHRASQVTAQPSSIYHYPQWRSATIPADAHPYLGFYSNQNGIRVNPIFRTEMNGLSLDKMTHVGDDPIGDANFPNAFLDLTSFSVAFTAEKIYFALRNASGGFPVSAGITYYAYMPILVNPAADPDSNPPVYGLMYTVNMAPIVSPALYKITGTGFGGLQSIGQIQSEIDTATNTLYLSCNIADLLADADFSAWFDPSYPLAGSMAITSRITLTGGTQEADSTTPANILFLPRAIPTANPSSPQISSATHSYEDGMFGIEVDYQDLDQNFPLVAEVYVDGVFFANLSPTLPINYANVQHFQLLPMPLSEEWESAQIRFSDNGSNIVSHTILNTTGMGENIHAPQSFSLYPNPARSFVKISGVDDLGKTNTAVEIYNLRGQSLGTFSLAKGSTPAYTIPIDNLQSGVYIMKLGTMQKRFIVIGK